MGGSGAGHPVRRTRRSGDEEGNAAYRALTEQMFLAADHLPQTWLADVEPTLPPRWRKLSGLSNTRVVLTVAELEKVEGAIEEVLARTCGATPRRRLAAAAACGSCGT